MLKNRWEQNKCLLEQNIVQLNHRLKVIRKHLDFSTEFLTFIYTSDVYSSFILIEYIQQN